MTDRYYVVPSSDEWHLCDGAPERGHSGVFIVARIKKGIPNAEAFAIYIAAALNLLEMTTHLEYEEV